MIIFWSHSLFVSCLCGGYAISSCYSHNFGQFQ